MKVYYLNESKGIKTFIVFSIIFLLFLSPWFYSIYLGNSIPIWLIVIVSSILFLDTYMIIVSETKKRLLRLFNENATVLGNEIIFDEPVDIEIGYCYAEHYVSIYTKNGKYAYPYISNKSPLINFQKITKLKSVTQVPIPTGEFFAYIEWRSDLVSGPGTKYLGKKVLRRCSAPAIRVTSGKYKNLFLIIFDNKFDIKIETPDDRLQPTENGIRFHNSTGERCKLTVRTSRTHEYSNYIIGPISTLTL